MGAGCSTSAEIKYRHLRNYLTSKPCLTFDAIQTFVSNDNGPPVILLGENHAGSESDSMVQRCVTVFTAMKIIVSKCSEPACKIHFIMEAPAMQKDKLPASFFQNKFHLRPQTNASGDHRDGDGGKTELEQFRVKFNLGDVIHKGYMHGDGYSDGFRMVPFDMFHALRALYTIHNHRIDDRLTLPIVLEKTKEDVGMILNGMGLQTRKVLDLFKKDDSEMEAQTRDDRRTVEVYIAEENEKNKVIWEEEKHYSLADEAFDEMYPDFFARPMVVHFWMFQVACWVYNLVIQVALETEYSPKFDKTDVNHIIEKLQDEFQNVKFYPGNMAMFMFITKCGDYITYLVCLRPMLHERNTNNIYVVYGGGEHVRSFSDLITLSNKHKQDLVRLADSVSCTPPDFTYKEWCKTLGKWKE
ncbi:unnamed protein product [Ectocarpus sp. 12 AP-2014]